MDEQVVVLVSSAMRSADMNVERLAEATGIPRVTLRRRLKEGKSFTIGELNRVSTALQVDILDLIPGRHQRQAVAS